MKKHIAEELPARKFKPAEMQSSSNKDGGGGEKKDADPQNKVRQAVYDIRYRARREEVPLQTAFSQYMANSSMSQEERTSVREKLFGESYDIESFASSTVAKALYQVFVEKKENKTSEDDLLNYFREEQILNSKGERKYKVEVVGTDGRSYVRYATREKINDLRLNPNIKSVEMTDKGEPYEGEKTQGKQTAAVKAGKDWDGDGKIESGSKEHAGAVHNAIQRKKGGVPDGQDTRKESVDYIKEIMDTEEDDKKEKKIDVMKKGKKNKCEVLPDDKKLNAIMASYSPSGVFVSESEMSEGQLKFYQMLHEKAVSQNQQQLAGMALAYLRGEMPEASDEVKKMAKMGEKKLRDFAKTKHEGLPEKVEEGKCETSNKEDEDTRGEYAEKNLIKNRLRAALGVKNPIVISASNEMEGEQIDEIAPLVGAGLALGAAALGAKALSDRMNQKRDKVTGKAPSATTGKPSLSDKMRAKNAEIDKLLKQSYEPEGEQIDELRKSEKLGLGSPDTSREFIPREKRKKRGEMGGRHFWSGGEGGSRTERGKKKNEPDSQHQRLNPPEEKGRQLERGRNAARQRWHSARD